MLDVMHGRYFMYQYPCPQDVKECMSDSVTNYNYVGDTKVSLSIKILMSTNAH